jgi:23S rRNA-intervening sequence protein
MDDFTQFDAFQRCREFARGVAAHLNRGTFSKDPILTAALRKTVLSGYANFGEGFERDGNREFAQFVSIAKGSLGTHDPYRKPPKRRTANGERRTPTLPTALPANSGCRGSRCRRECFLREPLIPGRHGETRWHEFRRKLRSLGCIRRA